MRYSVQPRDRIFVKGYGFLLFAKNTNKIIGKNVKYSQIVFDHAKQLATDEFKPASKRAIQKEAKATGDLLVIKFLIKSRKFQKIYRKIFQRQLHMRMIKKYLKKIYIPRMTTKKYWWSEINIIV